MGGPLTAVRTKKNELDQGFDSVVTNPPQTDSSWWHPVPYSENGNQLYPDDHAASEDLIDDDLLIWSQDDFPNGWRFVQIITADGQEIWEQIPLTEYDLLHPQDGDEIMNTTPHGKNTTYIDTTIDTRFKLDPNTVVLNDVGVDLNLPGIEHVSPDIAVIFNVTEVKDWGIFYCQEEGVSPSVIFEVTSPSTRKNDFGKKYDYYEQAGIPFYVILDVRYNADKQVDRYQLHVYEWVGKKYVEMEPNSHRRYWLPPLGIWVGVGEDGILCYDREGSLLLSHDELAQALADSERQREEATQRADKAVQRADEQELIAQKETKRAAEKELLLQQETQRAVEQERIAQQEMERAAEKERLLQQERLAKEAAEEEAARLRAMIEQLGGKL